MTGEDETQGGDAKVEDNAVKNTDKYDDNRASESEGEFFKKMIRFYLILSFKIATLK